MSFLLRLSIVFILAVTAMVTLWIWYSDFYYNFDTIWNILAFNFAFLALSLTIHTYSSITLAKRIAAFGIWLFLGSLFTMAGAPASYLFASVGGPFVDTYLAAVDQALGLDWVALLTFLSGHSWIGEYSSYIYSSSAKALAVIWVYLAITGRFQRGELLLASIIVSCFVIVAVAAPFAAKGPFGFYDVPPELYKDLAPVITVQAKIWFTHLTELRAGTFLELGPGVYEGIVEFPSFHTALSVLMILAVRGLGWVSWLAIGYNILILLTVPIDGGHYFVDMIAGGLIAVVTWYGLAALNQMVTDGIKFQDYVADRWGQGARIARTWTRTGVRAGARGWTRTGRLIAPLASSLLGAKQRKPL